MYPVMFAILLIEAGNAAWVEIPQVSNQKSFLGVTPYSPYIYEKSTFFTSTSTTSTTPSYEAIATPAHKYTFKNNERKSITKVPDSVMNNLLTTSIPTTRSFFRNTTRSSFTKRKTTTKPRLMRPPKDPQKNFTVKSTTSTTSTTTSSTTSIPKYNPNLSQVIINEHEYDESVYSDDEDDEEYDDGYADDRFDGDDTVDDEYYDDNEYENEEPATEKGDPEGFTYAGFLPYLKSIQSTLIRNSHKTAKSKVSFLIDIKNRLLYAIQEKISSLWGAKSRKARSPRGDYSSSWEKGDSEMKFPSNEGALLTLSFLTFAVFLIKCVLQLVHAMKHKDHHQPIFIIPVTTTTTTTAAPMRRIRSYISDEDAIRILQSMGDFQMKSSLEKF